jgi:hypothetical protein
MNVLITGLPGNGKTLYALQYVAAWAKREGRTVWYHGIKNLTPELGWHEVPAVVEKINGRDVAVPQWWLCPALSIVLIDEAQMCGFGVRPRGQVPEWAQKLEIHRHLGIDIVFITQDPKLIDSHDRALCELHFHVMRTFGMQIATIHEFRPVRDNIKVRKGSITHKWPFPKHVFKWYTSAEAHTHKRRIPMKVWVLLGIVVALPLLSWVAWARYLDPHRVQPGQAETQPAQVVRTGGSQASQGPVKLTREEWIAQQQPRVQGLAYTAPVYDDVTKPKEAPYPAACVRMGDRCGCYSQQATKLEVPRALCEGIVAGGFYVAWHQKQDLQPQVQKDVVSATVQPGGAGSFGGLPLGVPAASYGGDSAESAAPGRGKALPRPSL